MRGMASVLCGVIALLACASTVRAAITTIREYPDRYVVEIDGSMDKKIVNHDAPGQTVGSTPSSVAPAATGRTAQSGTSSDTPPGADGTTVSLPAYSQAIRAYMAQMPSPADRLEGRQLRRQARGRAPSP